MSRALDGFQAYKYNKEKKAKKQGKSTEVTKIYDSDLPESQTQKQNTSPLDAFKRERGLGTLTDAGRAAYANRAVKINPFDGMPNRSAGAQALWDLSQQGITQNKKTTDPAKMFNALPASSLQQIGGLPGVVQQKRVEEYKAAQAAPKGMGSFDDMAAAITADKEKREKAAKEALDMRPSYMKQQGQTPVPQEQLKTEDLMDAWYNGSNMEGSRNTAKSYDKYLKDLNTGKQSEQKFSEGVEKGRRNTRNELDLTDAEQAQAALGGGQRAGAQETTAMLSDDEKQNYYYLAGTQGKKDAENYRQYVIQNRGLNEQIAKRNQEAIAREMSYQTPVDRFLFESGAQFTLGAGGALDNMSRVPAALTGDTSYRAEGAGQYLSQEMANAVDTSTLSGKAYKTWQQLMNTSGNNAVSIAGGVAFGPGAGSALFAAQAAGDAYQQIINQGGTVQQAQYFAAMQAIDEEVTNALLGGIAARGGGLLKDAIGNTAVARSLQSALKGMFVNNPVGLRIANGVLDALANGGSEALQEYTQYFSEKFEKWLATGEAPTFNVDGKEMTWDQIVEAKGSAAWDVFANPEALESALMGFLNAGLMNGIGSVGRTADAFQRGRNLSQDSYQTVLDMVDPNITHYRKEDTYRAGKEAVELARDQQRRVEAGQGNTLMSQYGRGLMAQAAQEYQRQFANNETAGRTYYNPDQVKALMAENERKNRALRRLAFGGETAVDKLERIRSELAGDTAQAAWETPQNDYGVHEVTIPAEMHEQYTQDMLNRGSADRLEWEGDSGEMVSLQRENDGFYTFTNERGEEITLDPDQAIDLIPSGQPITMYDNAGSTAVEAEGTSATPWTQNGTSAPSTAAQAPSTAAAAQTTAPSTVQTTAAPTVSQSSPNNAPSNGVAISQQGAEGVSGTDRLAQLADEAGKQTVEQREAQRNAIYEAGKNRDSDFQTIMDGATMLSEAEKTAAFNQGMQDSLNEIRMEGQSNGRTEEGNLVSGEGSGRNVSLRAGEQASGVSQTAGGTAEVREERGVLEQETGRASGENGVAVNAGRTGNASGTGRRFGREITGLLSTSADKELRGITPDRLDVGEAIPAKALLRTAVPGQMLYPVNGGNVYSMRKAAAMTHAYDHNIRVTPFISMGEIRVGGGESSRAFADPVRRQLGFRMNDEEATSIQEAKHELIEFGIMDGKVNVDEAFNLVSSKIPDRVIGDILYQYFEAQIKNVNFDNLSEKEADDIARAAERHAKKEMICDIGAGIDQISGRLHDPKLKKLFESAHRIANEALTSYMNERLNNAFNAEPDIETADAASETTELTSEAMTDGVASDGITMEGEDSIQLSEKLYKESGRDFLRNWLAEQKDISKEDKDDIVAQVDHIYDIMQQIKEEAGNGGILDYRAWAEVAERNGRLTVITPNGEYPLNIDFATVCKKRKALDFVLNTMITDGDLDAQKLAGADIVRLQNIIKDEGFEIACALCFVDSKRYRIGKWADSIVNGEVKKDGKKYGYNELVRSLVSEGSKLKIDQFNYTGRDVKQPRGRLLKNASDSQLDFTLIDKVIAENKPGSWNRNLATAIKEHSELRSLLNSAELLSSVGFDPIKVKNPALFDIINNAGGSSKPKLSFSEVPYLNDILMSDAMTPEAAYAVGGVRIQSFSDFMANMVFDYVQMVSELQAKKLPAHAYTKEAAFVAMFGKTGIKINMSLVPKATTWSKAKLDAYLKTFKTKKEREKALAKLKNMAGLDAQGNYIWEDESFPYAVAMKFQADSEYAKNCGTIAVGVSDRHIKKLLMDPTIQMVIPYHKSGINPVVAKLRGIDLYNDYTNQQNTRYKKSGRKISAKANTFDFYGTLQETGDPRATAEAYLAWCKENDFIPKFQKFAKDPETRPYYYKLLADFRLYDDTGAYAPQGAVKGNYPDNMKDLILNGYSFTDEDGTEYHNGGLLDAQKVSDDLRTKTREIINRYNSGEKVQNSSKLSSEEVKLPDVESAADDKDNLNVIRQGSDQDIQYSSKLDSAGSKLTKAQDEYFKDSKVRDKDGNLLRVYHGTNTEFYEFDRDKIGSHGSYEGAGFNFTPSRTRASGYKGIGGREGRVMEGYLNITNPLSADKKTMSVRSLAKLIEKIDPTGDDLISNYAQDTRDYGKPSFVRREALYTARQMMNYHDSDVDIYSDLSASGASTNAIIDAYKDLGYDGLIHYDNDGKINTLIAFDSNQFKNIDNQNPTESEDIRYSSKIQLNKGDDDADLYYTMRSAINDKGNGWEFYKIDNEYDLVSPSGDEAQFSSVRDAANYYAEQTGDDGVQKRIDAMTEFKKRAKKYEKPAADKTKDSSGRKVSKAMQEYMKDSKMRNTNGQLKPMFHGSETAGFTIFDSGASDDKLSLFFSDDPYVSESYIEGDVFGFTKDAPVEDVETFADRVGYFTEYEWEVSEDGLSITDDNGDVHEFNTPEETRDYFVDHYDTSGVYEVYLNITNPLELDAKGAMWNNLPSEYNGKKIDGTDTRAWAAFAYENGYDGVIFRNIMDNGGNGLDDYRESTVAVVFNSNQVKSVHNQNPTENDDIRYSSKLKLRDKDNDYAPTFYSKLQREIGNFKGEKIGAASVESYLKGKGVKDEEIKWSGIRTFLEGKKSVSKAELMQYLRDNELQIEEKILGGDVDQNVWSNGYNTVYTDRYYDPVSNTEFKGEEDFRKEAVKRAADDRIQEKDIIFNISDDYMSAETEDGEVILEAMLPDVYELRDAEYEPSNGTRWEDYKLDGGKNYREVLFSIPGSDYSNQAMQTHWKGDKGVLAHARVQDFDSADGGKVLFVEEIQSDWHNAGQKYGYGDPNLREKYQAEQDAYLKTELSRDFSKKDVDNYMSGRAVRVPEDVLSEMTYKSTALVNKWNRENQDKAVYLLSNATPIPDAPFRSNYTDYVLKNLLRMAAEGDYDYLAWTTGKMQEERWSDQYAEGYRIEYDQQIPKFLKKYGKQWGAGLQNVKIYGGWDRAGNAPFVPAITVNDAMKQSVLTEGQPMYSSKNTGEIDEAALDPRRVFISYNPDLQNAVREISDVLTAYQELAPTQAEIKRTTRQIAKKFGSHINADLAARKMETLYNFLAGGGKPDGREVLEISMDIANDILDEATHGDPDVEKRWKNFKAEMRKRRIYIPKDRVHDLNPDGIKALRRQWKGKMLFTTDEKYRERYGQIHYQELQQMFPEYFTKNADTMNDIEAIEEIMYAFDAQAPIYEQIYTGATRDEAALEIAYDIMQGYFGNDRAQDRFKKIYRDYVKPIKDRAINDYRDKLRSIELKDAAAIEQRTVFDQIKGMRGSYVVNEKALKDVDAQGRRAMMERVRERAEQDKKRYEEQIEKVKAGYVERSQKDRLMRLAKELRAMKGGPEFEQKKKELIGDLDLIAKGISYNYERKLMDMKDEYERLADEDPNFEPDRGTLQKIERLKKKQINQMTSYEITALTEAILKMKQDQWTHNRMIRETDAALVADEGRKIVNETNALKGTKGMNRLADAIDGYSLAHLNSKRAFKKMSGYNDKSGLMKLWNELNEGQHKTMDFRRRAVSPFDAFMSEEENKDFITGMFDPTVEITSSKIEIEDENGNIVRVHEPQTVKITPAMKISIYLHSLNQDNREHARYGGFRIPNMDKYERGDYSNAYGQGSKIVRLTKADMQNIASTMTPQELRFADLAHEYFNKTSKEAINEASMLLNGYELASVENYMPIKTDPNFTKKDMSGLMQDGTIEGQGWTKDRNFMAKNPILLEDITQVLQRSIDGAALYYGLAIPIRNFNKVYNFQRSGYTDSVKEAIMQTFGKRGNEYIEKLLRDLQGGSMDTKDAAGKWVDRFTSGLRGNYAQAILTLNPSVAIKQAASYPTAAARLGFEPLRKALAKLPTSTQEDMDLINKYTPLLWYRAQGQSSDALAEVSKRKDAWQYKGGVEKTRQIFNWIQNIDVKTVKTLWYASEYYVQDNMPGLKEGTEAYYREVAKVFNEVVEDTQPNYTTMQRASISRVDNEIMKAVFMFKTQPLQNVGILYDSIMEYQAKQEAFKQAVKNGFESDALNEYAADMAFARQGMMRSVASITVSTLVFSAMTQLAKLLLHRVDPLRDEETGELTKASILKNFFGNAAESLAGMLAGAGEVYSLIMAMTTGSYLDNLSVSGIDSLNDTMTKMLKTYQNIGKILEDEETSTREKVAASIVASRDLAIQIMDLTGIPANNAKKIAEALVNHYNDVINPIFTGRNVDLNLESGARITDKQYANRALKYYQKGNIVKGDAAAAKIEKASAMQSALGAKGKKDENGNSITNSKKYDAIHRILRTPGPDEAKGKMYAAAYPSDELARYMYGGGSAFDFMLGQMLAEEIADLSEDERKKKLYSFVEETGYTLEQKKAWLVSDKDRIESKTLTAWRDANGTDWDYIKHMSNLEKFSGSKEKKKKVVAYIKRQTTDTAKRKALFLMAGYQLDSKEDGKTVKDGNFKKAMEN